MGLIVSSLCFFEFFGLALAAKVRRPPILDLGWMQPVLACLVLALTSALAASRPMAWPHATMTVTPILRMSAPAEAAAVQQYRVYLMNDSFNMREYVQRVLMMVAYISEAEAMHVMMRADWEFSAVVGTYEKPIADLVYEGMTKAGLSARIEAADDQPSEDIEDIELVEDLESPSNDQERF